MKNEKGVTSLPSCSHFCQEHAVARHMTVSTGRGCYKYTECPTVMWICSALSD